MDMPIFRDTSTIHPGPPMFAGGFWPPYDADSSLRQWIPPRHWNILPMIQYAKVIISVRCAQNPPRCFLFWWWQTSWRQIAFGLFLVAQGNSKNQPKRNPEIITKNVMADKWANAESNQHPFQNLHKSLQIGSGTIPGALGRLGGSLAPGRPRARKGHQKAAKP